MTQTLQKICAENGEGTVNDRMCQKMFVKYSAEDFLSNGVLATYTKYAKVIMPDYGYIHCFYKT